MTTTKRTWYIGGNIYEQTATAPNTIGAQTTPITRTEVSVMASGRIGVYYEATREYVYEYSDHLGNVRATYKRTVTGLVQVESYSDYYAFGWTLPGRQLAGTLRYRYGYQGQFTENDPETGWDAFELRMYDGRIGRWMSPDPARQYHSPYVAMGNDPVNRVDPDGGIDRWRAWRNSLGEITRTELLSTTDGDDIGVDYIEYYDDSYSSPICTGAYQETKMVPVNTLLVTSYSDVMKCTAMTGQHSESQLPIQYQTSFGGQYERIPGYDSYTQTVNLPYSVANDGPAPPGETFVEWFIGAPIKGGMKLASMGLFGLLIRDVEGSAASKLMKFTADEAVEHFGKHGSGVMNALGKSSYNLKNYITDANYIIKNGTFVSSMNGYVKLIGGKGSAKFGFVGLTRDGSYITTFHIKTASELSKKAPAMFGR